MNSKQMNESTPASWVIIKKDSGEVMFETFLPKLVECLNTEKYEAVPIMGYLAGLNKYPLKVPVQALFDDDTDIDPYWG